VVVPFRTESWSMVEDAWMTMPFVEDGVSASAPAVSTQCEPPDADAVRAPFTTERFVPVMSVITSEPILNEVAARFVLVAFVVVAFVPRSVAMVAFVSVLLVAKKFVDDAFVVVPFVRMLFVPKRFVKVPVVAKSAVEVLFVVVPFVAVNPLRKVLPDTVSAVLDA
jgi:hypothetical protein